MSEVVLQAVRDVASYLGAALMLAGGFVGLICAVGILVLGVYGVIAVARALLGTNELW